MATITIKPSGYVYVSRTLIDSMEQRVLHYMMPRYGVDASIREFDPLKWYIDTGRASGAFLSAVCNTRPYIIGRMLHKGGSYDEVINRIKTYLAAKMAVYDGR